MPYWLVRMPVLFFIGALLYMTTAHGIINSPRRTIFIPHPIWGGRFYTERRESDLLLLLVDPGHQLVEPAAQGAKEYSPGFRVAGAVVIEVATD